MAYQSLYRKYRPQTFADVMGQGHVTRTLQNALASNRVAHGYLFTGTRGTAKTTVARLLAKALNCQSADHPTAEPCNACSACTSITSGGAIDVIEMDAASHRGVADIEEVRKSVGYGPMELRYKVFIIDEAHQLSSDAKDAFLKTLEEPPDNVVFILATTEPQAIPITIRSRCQQFDFKRGSLQDIAARLRYVLDCEGVTYTPDAINLVSRGAEGSWRDALSLLEQVLAFAPTHLTGADVDTVLGTLDAEMLARVTTAIAGRDAAGAFALAGELLDAGKEARTLLKTLSAHFRDLLLVTVGGPAVAAELTPEEVGRLQQEARAFSPPQMMLAMDILNEVQGETRWNNQHRLLVELAFLKLMTLGEVPANAAQNTFATAPIVFNAPKIQTPQPVASVFVPPAVIVPPPVATEQAVTYSAPPPQPTPEIVVVAPPANLTPALLTEEEETTGALTGGIDDELTADFFEADSDPEDNYAPDDADEPVLDPVVAFASLDDGEEDTEPVAEVDNGPSLFGDDEDVLVPPVKAATPEPVPVEPEPEEELSLVTLDQVNRVWGEFLNKAGRVSKKTQTHMLTAHPSDVVRGTIEITFKARANYDMMNQPQNNEFVRKVLAMCLSVPRVNVHFVLETGKAAPPTRTAEDKKKETKRRDPLAQLEAESATQQGDGGNTNGFGGYHSPTSKTDDYFAPSAFRTEPPPAVYSTAPATGRYEPPAAKPVVSKASATMADNPLVQETLEVFGGTIVDETD